MKSEKLDRNTIVVFLSDNGPQSNEKSQAIPFRGYKWQALEGGTRVPWTVLWPGVVPPGQVSNQLIAAIDSLPSLCHACGFDLKTISKDSPVIDGVNVWGTLAVVMGAGCLKAS